MASSNRHWPSMFKSKPSNHPPHISSNPPPYTGGDGERSITESKPRWNPMHEQIQILEGILNSGMVNPPKDEIRRIRTRLEEYGPVGDASVFYWFQNRKSRSKNKLRKFKPSTSSTSFNKASPSNLSLSPFHQSNEQPLLHSPQGFGYPGSSSCVVDDDHELMLMNRGPLRSKDHDYQVDKCMNLEQQIITPTQPMHLPYNILPDLEETAPPKMTIFINVITLR